MSTELDQGLTALENALNDEHAALRTRDAEALTRHTAVKLQALGRVEALTRNAAGATGMTPSMRQRLQALFELNRRNGALIAANQRSVEHALTRLGRIAPQVAYDAHGARDRDAITRALGSA